MQDEILAVQTRTDNIVFASLQRNANVGTVRGRDRPLALLRKFDWYRASSTNHSVSNTRRINGRRPILSGVIFAINVTLDGCCNHAEVIADDELHRFYTDLLGQSGGVLFGRVTYQLLESSETLYRPTRNSRKMWPATWAVAGSNRALAQIQTGVY